MNFKEKMKLESKKKKYGLVIILLIFIVGSVYSLFSLKEYEYVELNNDLEIAEKNKLEIEEEKELKESSKKVYITGEVVDPGVYELFEEERIEDIIYKAGGVTKDADLKDVNLAYKVEDGQKIYIPSIYDVDKVEIVSTENGENVIKENEKSKKININNASMEKLCELPGVGEAMAKRIVEYREKNGKFNSIEELKNVSGIGEKKYEILKDFIEK